MEYTREELETVVVDVLKSCYDPEIPVDVYELGMIYGVAIDEEKKVNVLMTLTSPACPVAGSLPGDVETKLKGIPGVADAKVTLVWDPPWNPSMMSEAARLELGMF